MHQLLLQDTGNRDFGGPQYAETTIRLIISDVQNESPNFVGEPYRPEVAEDTEVVGSSQYILNYELYKLSQKYISTFGS